MDDQHGVLVLVRHGETAWSLSGQHTGATDIPLTEGGRVEARRLGADLADRHFALVLSSPMSRALETCRLAGFDSRVEVTDDLCEWDYGDYEGRTTVDIRTERPDWTLWSDGVPEGETAADVGARADRVIRRSQRVGGDALLFGHGHALRVLAARWLELPPADGRLFALSPATVSVLGYEREIRVIRKWNAS